MFRRRDKETGITDKEAVRSEITTEVGSIKNAQDRTNGE